MPFRVLFLLLLINLPSLPSLPSLTSPTPPPAARWDAEMLVDQMADDYDAHWSPDGSQIAFVGHVAGNPEVYVLDIASGSIRNISNHPEDDYAPLWSPDGRYVAFFHRHRPYLRQPHGIWVVDLTTGEQFEASDDATIYDLRWKDDSLVIVRQDGVWRWDAATDQQTQLASIRYERLYYSSVISPDGRRVALTLHRDFSKGLATVSLIDSETGNAVVMDIDQPHGFTWSPDSRYIGVTSGSPLNRLDLHIIDAESGVDRTVDQIAHGTISNLAWSPDDRLAWVVGRANDNSLRTLDALDQPPRSLLTIVPPIERVVWSPTRNHIAFQTYAGLYVVDVPSDVFSELAQGIGKLWQINWSADGNYLASTVYGIPGQTTTALVIVDIRDSRQRTVYDHQDYVGVDISWSPVDDRLLFIEWTYPRGRDIFALTFR